MNVEPRALVVGILAGLVVGATAGFLAGRFVAPAERAHIPPAPREAAANEGTAGAGDLAARASAPAERTEIPAGDNAAAEVDHLRARVATLEAEIDRLRALADARDPRRRRIEELVAANDLKYGELYTELAQLLLLDPEGVADDPGPVFALMVRLVDETGLALVPLPSEGEHERTLAPEPNAPDVRLILGLQKVDLVDTVAGASGSYTQETAGLRLFLKLPKSPESWKGGPLDLELHLLAESDSRGEFGANFSATGRSFEGRHGVAWRGLWFRDKSLLHRSPRSGSADVAEGGPADFAPERRLVEELFQKLKTRAR